MSVKNYRDLIVWQKAMDLVVETYKISSLLPSDEIYGLSSQMRRSAVSVPSNIAEGQQRSSAKEFSRFLRIAIGSVAELETQIEICLRLDYLRKTESKKSIELCTEIGKMLNGLLSSIENN